MVRMIPTQSSSLAAIGSNPDNSGEVIAQFQSGKTYRYQGVPAEVILGVIFDPDSQGKAFNQKVVRASYPYEEITDPAELETLRV